MKRPFAWSAACFAAGIFASSLGFLPLPLSAALFVAAPLLLASFVPLRFLKQALLIAALFLPTGYLYAYSRQQPPSPLEHYLEAHRELPVLEIEGVVREAPLFIRDGGYCRAIVDVESITVRGENVATSGALLLRWFNPPRTLQAAERIRARGEPNLRMSAVNHGVHSYEEYLRARGVCALLDVRESGIESLGSAGGPAAWVGRLREAEAGALARNVPKQVMPLLLTLWLGESGQILPEEYERYVASGTAHILSVSGVHVGLIFFSALYLLSALGFSRRTRLTIAMLAVFTFAIAAGARPATMRAALMIFLAFSAEWFDREPDAQTALGFSAWLQLLYNPHHLFDLGFILSFTSVASMILFNQRIEQYLKALPRFIATALATSVSVQIFSFPFAVDAFHLLPLLAPLANLLIIPVLTLLLWLAFGVTVFAAILPPLALLLGHAMVPLVYIIEGIASGIASVPIGRLTIVSPTTFAVLLYLAAGLTLYGAMRRGRNMRWWSACASLGVAAWLFWRPLFPPPVIDFIDVGHGDATFIRTPGGTTMLIDGGDLYPPYTDVGKRIVEPFLLGNHVTHLDYVMLSHADGDHIGGLLHVTRRFSIGEVIAGPYSGRPLEAQLVQICNVRGIPIRRVAAGEMMQLSGAMLQVLHPATGASSGDINNSSLVARLTWPGMSLLLTGDIEAEVEDEVAAWKPQANILKVPHHGSVTSSTQQLVEAVNTRHAVISTAGPQGKSRLNLDAIARYGAAGAEVWRTDLQGGLRFKFGGDAFPSPQHARSW